MTTKIRPTVLALVAAVSFAATAVPAAQAQPNTGGFNNSAEGQKQQRCDLLANLFASDMVAQHRAAQRGDRAAQATYAERSHNDVVYARKAGCAWAA